jgi:hypothetical protein
VQAAQSHIASAAVTPSIRVLPRLDPLSTPLPPPSLAAVPLLDDAAVADDEEDGDDAVPARPFIDAMELYQRILREDVSLDTFADDLNRLESCLTQLWHYAILSRPAGRLECLAAGRVMVPGTPSVFRRETDPFYVLGNITPPSGRIALPRKENPPVEFGGEYIRDDLIIRTRRNDARQQFIVNWWQGSEGRIQRQNINRFEPDPDYGLKMSAVSIAGGAKIPTFVVILRMALPV